MMYTVYSYSCVTEQQSHCSYDVGTICTYTSHSTFAALQLRYIMLRSPSPRTRIIHISARRYPHSQPRTVSSTTASHSGIVPRLTPEFWVRPELSWSPPPRKRDPDPLQGRGLGVSLRARGSLFPGSLHELLRGRGPIFRAVRSVQHIADASCARCLHVV